MNKALIALLSFMGSVLVQVQAGEPYTNKYNCVQHPLLGGGHWHCSHHPLNKEVLERLECMNERCELKKDTKTGDIFHYTELDFEGGEKGMGYKHNYLYDQ